MIGFYVLLLLGFVVYLIINIFLYSVFIFKLNFFLILIMELVLLWVCFGPQLVLYYFLKLKATIDSYKYLYEEYIHIKRLAKEMEFQNILDKKSFKEKLKKESTVPYEIIEGQKEVILGLTKLRDKLKRENKLLKETNKKNNK